jgi:hypothetical protein
VGENPDGAKRFLEALSKDIWNKLQGETHV